MRTVDIFAYPDMFHIDFISKTQLKCDDMNGVLLKTGH